MYTFETYVNNTHSLLVRFVVENRKGNRYHWVYRSGKRTNTRRDHKVINWSTHICLNANWKKENIKITVLI